MRSFEFLFSVRFWIAVWIVILFVALAPLPPAAELVIVAGCVAHGIWFLHHRLRALAARRALARAEKAEEEEFRRLRRRRALRGDSPNALPHAEPADPTHHDVSGEWSLDHVGSHT